MGIKDTAKKVSWGALKGILDELGISNKQQEEIINELESNIEISINNSISNINTNHININNQNNNEIKELIKKEISNQQTNILNNTDNHINNFDSKEFLKFLEMDKGRLSEIKTLFSNEINSHYWINNYPNTYQYLQQTGASLKNYKGTNKTNPTVILNLSTKQQQKILNLKEDNNLLEKILDFNKLINEKLVIYYRIIFAAKEDKMSEEYVINDTNEKVISYDQNNYKDILYFLTEENYIDYYHSQYGNSNYSLKISTKETLKLLKDLKELIEKDENQ